MAIATAAYTVNDVDHILRKNTASGATWVSRAHVGIVCGADDTYATGGITPDAASCKLTKINTIKVLAATDGTLALIGQQAALGAATPKVILYVAATGAEVANGADITNYTLLLEVEGYAP